MALTDGLFLHLGLQDNAASTTVVATVGSNATATANTNTLATAGPNAALPSALQLDNNTQYVTLPSISFASGDDASYRLVYARLVAGTAGLLGRTGDFQYQVRTASNGLSVRVADSAVNFVDFTIAANNLSWHDLMIIKAGTSYRVYFDGAESSSGALTLAGSFGPAVLGRYFTNDGNAKFASCSIWNRALSGPEITALHNSGNWLAYPWTTGPSPAVLAHYYAQMRANN